LGACNDQNNEDKEQEPEQIVELVLPNCGKNKEQLDKNGAKGQNTRHEHTGKGRHKPLLLGYLPMDLIRSHRILVRRLLLAVIVAQEDQWDRYAKPQQQNGDHRSEWNSAGRFLAPDEKVEDETNAKDNARVQGLTLQHS